MTNISKVKFITILSLIIILGLMLFVSFIKKESNNKKGKGIPQENEISSDDTKSKDIHKKQLNILDYDDLAKEKPYKSGINSSHSYSSASKSKMSYSSTDSNKNGISESKSNESKNKQNNEAADSKVNVIDESPETIVDKSVNEYKGEKNAGKIEFFDVKPSGKQPNGHVNPGGKQNVGSWN